MRYVCLGFIDQEKFADLPQEEALRLMEECLAYDDELRRGGHFLGGEALDFATNAVTLRMKEGQVDVTDGPFAETKENLGGILLLEARDLNHAIALMSKHPGVRMGPFEIRPANEAVNHMVAERTAKVAREANQQGAVIHHERLFSASTRQIFNAFKQPEQLAHWWGPKDFTNTFETFEFQPGGRWVFVMHGPNGADYPNESIFREIQPDAKIAIEHIAQPWFRLTVTLTPRDGQTHLAWDQEFDSPEVAAKFRPLCATANEQNLDRLQSLLSRDSDESGVR